MTERIALISLYEPNSFSMRTLSAVLKRAGFDARLIVFKRRNAFGTMDFATRGEIAALTRLIGEIDPIFVGISVRSPYFMLASEITRQIKAAIPALVVWGGIHPTVRPEESIAIADIVCIGEGEDAAVELAKKLSRGDDITRINNLWVKKAGGIIRNDARPLQQDLDALPFPDFSDESAYIVENGAAGPLLLAPERVSYSIMTSRGCPFSCTYCSNSILRKIYKGKYVRRRSVESVMGELEYAKSSFKKLKFIIFDDDVFTFDIPWLKRFCEQYKEKIDLPFLCYCHPEAVNEEIIQLIKAAGALSVTMGIQTGSEAFRRLYYGRPGSNEQIVMTADLLHKYRITSYYDLILDNPLESDEDRQKTFELLLRLPRPFETHLHRLVHFPETEFTKLLLDRKLISPDDISGRQRHKSAAYPSYAPSLDMTRDRENLFWDNLFYMAGKSYMRKPFLVRISRSKFFRRYPRLLTVILKCTSFSISTVRRGSKIDEIRFYMMQRVKQMFVKARNLSKKQ